ncbi:MAG: hypothetical protein ACI4EX_01780 [Lachnospiraceae bacterium]
MSERKLTREQEIKIEELKKEFAIKAKRIPEPDKPHNRLDGGGGPFHDLSVEFQKRMHQILDGQ